MELHDMTTAPRKPKATTTTATTTKKSTARKPVVKKNVPETKPTNTRTRKPSVKAEAPIAYADPVALPTAHTLDQVLNSLINMNPDLALVTAKKGDSITLLSCGEVSLPEAIVLIGTLAASIFTEIPTEQKAQYPLSAFMNNISTVTAGRVAKIDPTAPLFVPLTNHEG